MATQAEKAQQEQIQASREAAAFFQLFDKSSLYYAVPQRETGWLLGEKTQEMEALSPHVPISRLSLPCEENEPYAMFIPVETASNSKPLQLQELHRIVWELVVGVYVFNSIPSISLQRNHDGSSTCAVPSAYHDTLVGTALFEVDYFIKSLLHGTSIPQRLKRDEINETWKKMAPNSLWQHYKDLGLVYMIDDPELGHDLYEPKKTLFIRHPPNYVDSDLAHSELTPRLTTGQEFEQQETHISRDVFLRFLDNISIGLVFTQGSIQQDGNLFVLDTAFKVTSRVTCMDTDNDKDSDLQRHLHSYLQKQHNFVADNLQKKKEISHYLELLRFASFLVQFLVTLKQQKKIVSVAKLTDAKSGKTLHTSREVPPVLPSEMSCWSPFTARDSHSSLNGEIQFHMPQKAAVKPGADFMKAYESLKVSGSLTKSRELVTIKVGDRDYHILPIFIEDYYPKSPKLPRWVHCMVSELTSQYARLPSLNPRIQEFLRKSYSSRETANMQTVPAQLLASIVKGHLPLVALLLKRCTKTHLGKLDDVGRGLVHYAATACHTDVLSALLLAGCSVDQCCLSAQLEATATQPIHMAARSGSLDTVVCLLHFGADVLAADSRGWTAVHYAALHNYQSIVMHVCAVERECIGLKTNDSASSPPLLLAARNGGFDTVCCLVELGADITARDSCNQGIVQIAVKYHHVDILKYLVSLQTDVGVFEELSTMLVADASSGYPEAAARTLDPLTQWKPVDVATALLKHGTILSLVELIRKADEKIRHLAVQVLANISSDSRVKSALVEANAVPPLISLLASGSERVQACTSLVLSDLAMTPNTQAVIVQSKAVPHLVKLLASETDDVQLYSTACLGILAFDNSSNQMAIAGASAIPALKPLLNSDLSCIQACAANTIQALVEENRSCQLGALADDLLSPLVQILRSKEVSVHTSAALAIEAIAEECLEAQQELLGNSICIKLLKRLLRMRNSEVKVAGGCALWAIAGHLISNQRFISSQMGLDLLVNMLTIHNEKLDYVCSEALGSLATELGDNQKKIMEVGGVKPLIEVLLQPTSQRVYLSVISTLSKLIIKPALKPNKLLQKEVAGCRGISVLSSIVSSHEALEIVRISAARTLALLVLQNPENSKYLENNTEFSLLKEVIDFLSSSSPKVQVQAGQCLAIMALNNPQQLATLKHHHPIDVNFYTAFLESGDEYLQCCAGFQLVVLSKILTGINNAKAAVKGIHVLVNLLGSDNESTQVMCAEFLATLAHSSPGIPEAIIMSGVLDTLISNLTSGSGPVIENCCVALGYFSFHKTAARLLLGYFRDEPEKCKVFQEYSSSIIVSKEFMSNWQHTQRAGLPVLSLESRGGPPATEGWRTAQHHSRSSRKDAYQCGRMQGASLGDPSTLTQGTEQKSHSTLHRISFADTATATASATLPHTHSLTGPEELKLPSPHTRGGGLLTMRKMALDRQLSSKGRGKGVGKVKQIEGAHIV